MPDQSSAASEHAILQEITAPLDTLPDDAVAAVHADFPVALRGYDRLAVDAYVKRTSQLVAELQATRSPEAAVRRALERVGEQISGILQRAHETAEEITSQSRREGEDRLEHSRVEAAEIVAAAHQRVKDLDADTDRIWVERHRIVDDARELAQQLMALADSAVARFPEAEEATEVQAESPAGAAPGAAEPDLAESEPDDVEGESRDAEVEPDELEPDEVEADKAEPAAVKSDDAEAATAIYDRVEAPDLGEPPADQPSAPDTASHPTIPPSSDAATRRADK